MGRRKSLKSKKIFEVIGKENIKDNENTNEKEFENNYSVIIEVDNTYEINNTKGI
jgi:hypothetical protein